MTRRFRYFIILLVISLVLWAGLVVLVSHLWTAFV